jgi:hypothetical protein
MYVIDRILNSNTTLIGHDARNEISVEKILNSIPGIVSFGKDTEITDHEILNYFDSVSHIRNYKISLLKNENIIISVYLNNLIFEKDDNLVMGFPEFKSKKMKNFLSTLQSRIYLLSCENSIKIKLVLVTSVNKTFLPSGQSIVLKGGDFMLYMCDVAIQIIEDKIQIIKDRQYSEKNFHLKEEIRELSINQILNE